MLKRIRQLHLYLGLLFAPSIIFFAFSGTFQLYHKHEAQPGDTSQPPRWIALMAAVHKDQNLEVQERPLRPAPKEKPAGEGSRPAKKDNLALKLFFTAMAFGLIVTSTLGIYMAFKFNRDRRVIWGLLAAGIALPLLALFLGA